MPNIYHFNADRPAEDLILSENHKVPGHVAQYLKNFQLEGIRFLYKHFDNNQSCILNDESGLGKTATVCAFLDTVLPHDSSRNCLIIVKNDERLRNWKFHLDALTKLSIKIAFKEEDVGKEIVYLTKWNSFQKSASLAKCNFDCIIIDNREDLMANKICSGYLLRNYENKISLVISSTDVAVDLRQFHTILRLCGRLDKKYENMKTFEDKFSLPVLAGVSEDVNLLEAYFLRREKINNFCRDFRLRRYRHQYEDELPLVQLENYQKSLNMWMQFPLCNSTSSSSSIRILTSSSEKDAEQLLKTYFHTKEENELNMEVSKITTVAEKNNKFNQTVEVEEMPPLFFESDSEDQDPSLERLEHSKLASFTKTDDQEFLIPISIVREREKPSKQDKRHHESIITPRVTRSTAHVESKFTENKSKSVKKGPMSRFQRAPYKRKQSTKSSNITPRNMRSHLATRSKTQRSKYLVIDITHDDIKKKENSRKYKRKVKKPEVYMKKEKVEEKKGHATRSKVKNLKFKIFDDPDHINKRRQVRRKLEKETTLKRKVDSPTKNFAASTKDKRSVKNNKKVNIEKKNTVEISPNNSNLEIKRNSSNKVREHSELSKRTATEEMEIIKNSTTKSYSSHKTKASSELQNSGDVHFVSPPDQIIVLSSSTEECTPPSLNNNSIKQKRNSRKISPSPDIFGSVTDECEIVCSQKSKPSGELKTLSSTTKGGIFRNCNSSCLDLLEMEFQKEKRNTKIHETEEIIEISTSETFKNILRGNDGLSEITPVRSRSVTFQKNKITKYLIGNEVLSQSLETTPSNEAVELRKIDSYPKTPKHQRSLQKSSTTSKKSPKATGSGDITPNSLTKWLIKPGPTSSNVPKPSKRRKLDLWFND